MEKNSSYKAHRTIFLALAILCISLFSVPNIAGAWTEDLNDGLLHYWNFNTDSGSTVTDNYGVGVNKYSGDWVGSFDYRDGIEGQGIYLEHGLSFINISENGHMPKGGDNFTISAWVNFTESPAFGAIFGTNTNEGWDLFQSGDTNLYGYTDAGSIVGTGIKAFDGSGWAHVVWRKNDTLSSIYVNGTQVVEGADLVGTNIVFDEFYFGYEFTPTHNVTGEMDEIGVWNRSLTDAEVAQLWNSGAGSFYSSANYTTVLNSPALGATQYNRNVTFNCSTEGLNSSFIVENVSLYLDNILNYTITDGTDNFTSLQTTLSKVSYDDHEWYCIGYGNGGEPSNSTPQSFTVEAVRTNTLQFNTSVYESDNQTIEINISYDSDTFATVTAELLYNGSSFSTSQTGTGDNLTFSSSFNTPATDVVVNKSFIFNFTLIDAGTGETTYFATGAGNQTVKPVSGFVVDTACTDRAYHFTLVDENNFTSLNGTFNYNFQYGISNGTLNTIYGNITNSNHFYVCINNTESPNWTIGSGEIAYSAPGYVERRYYIFDDQTVTNDTTNITLYDLDATQQTSFRLEVQTPSLSPYQNKYISVLRWYPNLNEYKIIEMGKTDDEGRTVLHVRTEDYDHRIGVYELDGELIYLASPIRMVCLTSPCSYTLNVQETETYAFDDIYDIQTSLDYSSGIFSLSYNDPSQHTELMELQVYKIGGTASDVLVCSSNSSSYTGYLVCDVSSETGILKAVAIRTASPSYYIASKIVDTSTTVFQGTFGLFIQFLITGTLIFLGVVSPIAGIILGLASLIFGAFLFKTITYPIMIGIAIVAGLVIHFMRRSQ